MRFGKRMLCGLYALFMIFAATACSSQGQEQSASASAGSQEAAASSELSSSEAAESTGENAIENAIVVYFSVTGNTEEAAGYIADSIGADIYEITPAEEYTSDDLNWNDHESRVSVEHENPDSRPEIAGELPDLSGYDTIFLGYPIWWGEAPNIVRTFMESVDISGKTVVPFCTSSSSGLGSSAETLQQFAPEADWAEGHRFSSNVDEADVEEWINSIN